MRLGVLTSKIGRLVVAPALAGMQPAAWVFKWCTACAEEDRRDCRMVLMRIRNTAASGVQGGPFHAACLLYTPYS